MVVEASEIRESNDNLSRDRDFHEIDVALRGKILRVRKLGDDDKPLIILQHGIQSHSAVWEKLAKLLCENGFQVLMPDRRGHGFSDHFETYHLLDYVSDLNHIMNFFCCESVSLVGHCESSMITTLLAGARPEIVRQLLNIQFPIPPRAAMEGSAKVGLVRTFLQKIEAPQQHIVMKNIDEVAERSIAGAPFPMPKDVALHVARRNSKESLYGSGLTWRWDPAILDYRLLYNTFDMSILASALEKFSKPVSFIYGKDSALMKTDKERHIEVTRMLSKKSKQILVPGGHYPHMEIHAKTLASVIIDCISNDT